ncbi:SNF2 family ATP-dependent chromatin-remodeling factor snf21 [Magnaporthiopsis poae ATCC 64411]|uniref:SNF2 family ATP-dependent chromatin-remodeling factor snf21 n=1 Tax=Magnaporthiopsis poae (strain ATCC 64411 / 73-15) TaxID=644358 RepID=A0A0C4DTP9_MAGP6|nr:SNF2 family ATP-dependent chromatin-remodeling factor snf21 [Magnaporthiopsis poae ATCC 64411]
MEDPWDFDSNRLVQELCTDNCSWTPPSKGTRPDPDALKEKILELDLDGEFLLRYAGSAVDVFNDLGIKEFSHKRFLLAVVEQLRDRSKKYRRETKGEPSPDEKETIRPSTISEDAAGVSFPSGPQPSEPVSLIQARPGADEGSRKKRRLAPLNVSATPIHDAPVEIPNQADTVIGFAPVVASTKIPEAASIIESQQDLQPSDSEYHYYGSKPILADDFEPDVDPDDEDFGVLDRGHLEFSFTCGTSARRPAGHRIAMSRSMRRYLRSNLRGAAPAGRKGQRARQITPDVALEPFGESDSEGYDTDTWEEIEQERLEREERLKEQEIFTKDEISGLLNDLISELEEEWRTAKLPKHETKAHKIWSDARRRGSNRGQLILLVKREAGDLDARLAKICDSISDDRSFQKTDLLKHRESIQPTVYARMYSHWLITVLASLTEPDRPKVAPRPRPKKAPKAKLIEDGVEAYELTSESEPDDVGNFVVDDGDVSMEDAAPEVSEQDGDAAVAAMDDAHPDNVVAYDNEIGRDDREDDYENEYEDEDRKPCLADLDGQSVPNLGPGIAGAIGGPEVIDLTDDTPPKKPLDPTPSSPRADSVPRIELPASTLNNPEAIASYGADHWHGLRDGKRMVITMLYHLDATLRSELFSRTKSIPPDEIEEELVTPSFGHNQRTGQDSQGSQANGGSPELYPACVFTRLFLMYIDPSQKPTETSWLKRVLGKDSAERASKARDRLSEFCGFLSSIADNFPEPEKVAEDIGDSSDQEAEGSPAKKRKQVKRDKEAMDMRQNDKRRLELQEERRRALRRQLASSGDVSGEKSRLIINETKEESQGLIYVPRQMADHIKDHQIQGVRFMWNQVITSQGCLLAHTMGLGKTMQVICLLVIIAEASLSEDPSLFTQIPEDLRDSKTLVLCPSGLVQNWLEELARWAPAEILGRYYTVDSELEVQERFRTVRAWSRNGGVLIMGYPMFRVLSMDGSAELVELLKETPNIVVGDEAHHMKNQKSKISTHTAGFKTKTRIAMTGSPLANSVSDYYAMVSWVAPNYLGPPREFASIYATPIHEGLYIDSPPHEKRRALKLLKALKDTVAPKIHRMTMATLKDQLPLKKEFVIYVPLTKLQMDAYSLYMSYFSRAEVRSQLPTMQHLFEQVSLLTMLLTHPKVFLTKLHDIKEGWGKEGGSPKPKGSKSQGDKESMLPRGLVGELIKCLKVRDSSNFSLSNKVIVLLRILDEAKAQGDKVLLFSSSIITLDFLESVMKTLRKPYSRLDGKTVISKRQGMVARFNENKDEVYLISTAAGGVGLNIQGANRIVIMDFKWSPVNEQQAIGRAYRIGQTKPVFVYWLIVGGTYEPKLHGKSIFKTQLASRVVDKKNPHAHANKYSSWTQPPQIMTRTDDLSNAKGHDVVLDAVLESPAGASICKVTLGDLFEEEEPESQLSAEELKEAEDLVKANHLRHTDPEAFAKMNLPLPYTANVPPPAIPPMGMGMRAPQQASTSGKPTSLCSTVQTPQADGVSPNAQSASFETPVPLPQYITQQQRQKSKTPVTTTGPNAATLTASPIDHSTPAAIAMPLGQGNAPQGGYQPPNPVEAVPAQNQDSSSAAPAPKAPGEPQGVAEPIPGTGTAFRAPEPPNLTPGARFLAEVKSRAPALAAKTDSKALASVADIFGRALQDKGLTGLPMTSAVRKIVDVLTEDEGVWNATVARPDETARVAARSIDELKEAVAKHTAKSPRAAPASAGPSVSGSKDAARTPRRPPRVQGPDHPKRSANRTGGLALGSPSSPKTRRPTRSEQNLPIMDEVFRRRKAKAKPGQKKPARMPTWAVEGIQTPPQRRAGDDPQTPLVLDD